MPWNNTSDFPGIFKTGGCKLASCVFLVIGLVIFLDESFN